MTVLERIISDTKKAVAERKRSRTLGALDPSERDFKAAISGPELSLIAEIKRRSPSKGVLRETASAEEIATIYDRHAAAISVLTNAPYFGGSHSDLAVARQAATRPILCKDFVVEPWQIEEARHYGADAILLMASVLPCAEIERCLTVARALEMHALVEVHSEDEMRSVLKETSADIIGINSRDLHTLRIDDEVIFALAPLAIAVGKVVVAESGVHRREQVDRLRGVANAVLIGSSLMSEADIEAKIEALGW